MARPRKEPKEPGFRCSTKGAEFFFPIVYIDNWRQGDVPLVEAVTGKEWATWIGLLKKHGLEHPVTRMGYFAVALQRAKDATDEQVVEFVRDLPLDGGIEFVVPVEEKPSEDAPAPPDAETAD